MYKCPCCLDLVGELTNYHCTTKHQMSKKEVIEKYGQPEMVRIGRARNIDTISFRAMDQR